MKTAALAAAMLGAAVLIAAQPANAAGCVKGAVVGGVAGHYMGHHGWLGAAAGCLIGRHEANKQARQDHRYQSYQYRNY